MRLPIWILRPAVLLLFLASFATAGLASRFSVFDQSPDSSPSEQGPSSSAATITVPPGTRVALSLASPLWAATTRLGDPVYAMSVFPVAANGVMQIPPGTYFQGQIDAFSKPGWGSGQAQFQIHFTKMIFASGYTIELPNVPAQAATATVHVAVSSRNDVLLDIGAQFDMLVQLPLVLDATKVRDAAAQSRPAVMPAKNSSQCRTIPGSPGTSDTVIPGTPPTPGTPPIVIPGGPGMPDTVIPGTPGSPGTAPTIIPGTPATPNIPCPNAPIVISSTASAPEVHLFSFSLSNQVKVAKKKMDPGDYQLSWTGTDTTLQADLLRNGKTQARAAAHIVMLPDKAAESGVTTRKNQDGSLAIESLTFAGENFSLVFD